MQPQFAGSLQLPDSLRPRDEWTQTEWLAQRPYALSGFERLDSYRGSYASATDSTDELRVSFYNPERPKFYDLGQGQDWLNELSTITPSLDSTDAPLLELAAPEGRFRFLAAAQGGDLLVQQQLAAGGWRTQLRLSLRARADSLLSQYGPTPPATIDLPRPLVLQARAGRLRLRLFVSSLNRQPVGSQARYDYMADGLLQIAAAP